MILTVDQPTTTDTDQLSDLFISVVRNLMVNNPSDWLNLDLTFQQLKVLYTLKQYGSLPMARLADAMTPRVSMPTITGIITRLIERRDGVPLVERESSPDDRRIVRARLTPAGQMIVERITEPNKITVESVLVHMTSDEHRALYNSLAHVLKVLNAHS